MVLDIEVAVGLFPGQGGYRAGCLDGLIQERAAGGVIQIVDDVAADLLGRHFIDHVTGAGARAADDLFANDPDLLQVATFATSVALFEALRARGARLTVLLGHSLGEIAALVCSGALTVAEGTRTLCQRIRVLREYDTSGGGMQALGCDRARAEQIVGLLPSAGITIAAENGAGQIVLSGTADALRRVEQIAGAIGVPTTALRSPHPFHNPLLRPARQELVARIGGQRSHAMRLPVFSPILGRYYRESDDLGELLASHLMAPVEFRQAVGRAHRAGARIWVEIGAGRTLANLVRSAYPDTTVLTPLHGPVPAVADVAAFLGGKADAHPPAEPVSTTTPASPTPATPLAPAYVEPGAPAPTQPATTAPSAPADAADDVLSRAEIEQRVRALYANSLEYPEEVFEPDAELEADLGIDSVKQTELMARLGDIFGLGPRPDGLRVADYRTFGTVVDFVRDSLARNGAR